jgi:eukaryotic-like serine/threonine-protein kinase
MPADRRSNDKADTRAITTEQTSVMAAAPTATYLGALFKDRYLIERELGRGGIGAIYLALDRQLMDKPVVIKVMLSELEASQYLEYFKQKFRQEIKALARIDHPGIVGVFDVGETPDGKPYFVMQYVKGQSLRMAINEAGSKGMELARVAALMRQIGYALSAAHDKGIYHRDLKPENIMLQDLGRGEELAKLIDFGMATVKDSQSAAHTEVTKVAGTLPYMAPEQLRGKPSALSDVFSSGVIAYEMVTGYLPFKSDSPVQQYELQRAGVSYLPCELRPGLPVEAQTVILKALAFDAQERYQSAREFADELVRALGLSLEKARKQTAGLAATGRLKPPFAGADLRSADRQAHVHKFDTPAHAAKATQPITETPSTVLTRKSTLVLAPLAAAAVLLVLALFFWPHTSGDTPQPSSPSPSVAPSVATVVEPTLNFALIVQRYRNGKPYKKPFQLAGAEAFNLEAGDRVRFQINSPQTGYLYLINEGPQLVNELPDYNLLFPAARANGGTAQVQAHQLLQVPDPELVGLLLDTQTGTEKIWLIWSAQRLDELENIRPRLTTQGVAIQNPADIRTVQQLLATHTTTKPEIIRDEASKQSQLKGRGPVLATLLSFEHH